MVQLFSACTEWYPKSVFWKENTTVVGKESHILKSICHGLESKFQKRSTFRWVQKFQKRSTFCWVLFFVQSWRIYCMSEILKGEKLLAAKYPSVYKFHSYISQRMLVCCIFLAWIQDGHILASSHFVVSSWPASSSRPDRLSSSPLPHSGPWRLGQKVSSRSTCKSWKTTKTLKPGNGTKEVHLLLAQGKFFAQGHCATNSK